MKLLTVKEFRDHATKTLKSKEPLVILRRGGVAGVFLPTPLDTIPLVLRKDLFVSLTESVKKRLHNRRVTEDEVLEDF